MLDRIVINISDARKFGPRFLLRHLGRLKKDRISLVPLPDGKAIYARAGESDIASVRQTFADQYAVGFNSKVANRVDRRYHEILDAGDVPAIVDAGANIGAASLWFADRYPKAKVIAIEPEPENFKILQLNAKLRSNIIPVSAAIGAAHGFVQMSVTELGWSARSERSEEGIPIVTMEEAFMGAVPFMSKIDIEGFESDLFSDNTGWLSKTFVVFVEPHDWLLPGQNTSRSFQAAMGREDYEIYLNGEILTYVRRAT